MRIAEVWKADWFVGAVVGLVLVLAWLSDASWLQRSEFIMYDIVASSTHNPDQRVQLITIDDSSIERMGAWPWPRNVLAEMITRLSQAGAKVIVLDVLLSEAQVSPSLDTMRSLIEALQTNSQNAQLVQEAQKRLDVDAVLARSLTSAGNVYLPMRFTLGPTRNRPLPPSKAIKKSQISKTLGESRPKIVAGGITAPFDSLANTAAGIGHMNMLRDIDGEVRGELLAIQYANKYYPSISLLAVANFLQLPLSLDTDAETFTLGNTHFITDNKLRLQPAFFADEQFSSLPTFTFHDVATGLVPLTHFRDKLVFIGLTATGIGEKFTTPAFENMSAVNFHAHTANALIKRDYFSHPSWLSFVELFIILLVLAYLVIALPRLAGMPAILITTVVLLIILISNLLTLYFGQVWLQAMVAVILLLSGHIILTIKRSILADGIGWQRNEDNDSDNNKMLGMSFQRQGMLEMALEKYRKCPVNDEIKSLLYTLAMDFERKRKFSNAQAVYEYISEHDPEYKDIEERLERARNVGETMVFGASGSDSGLSNMLLGGTTKPTLGRYEIIKELGKGAMGVVYLGLDPKINRQVAIKTMALAQEFEPNELEEVKLRFFREAETAGRLNHPNIVTMFDAGEEHDLAYIAMEFLDGVDLMSYTKPGKLMPRIASMKIVGKVAEALNYAHARGVVHRDIKPANIMLLKNKVVKVTDFGIARITVSSKTKTGVVLGTPSYMSPEQLSGKHVDGRSDLFSLGIMLYELLTGTRPFKGESMATLMFQIANEPHPDIREFQADLPQSVADMIDKALAKEADSRYTNGAEMVQAIISSLRDMTATSGRRVK
ncbi:MAG: serine/threonine-protein kinase [Mariprofundales bacterium]